MMTHKAVERDVQRALADIGKSDFVALPTRLIRVQE